eukprot:scaffold2191_cov254-Pinguiococcus_pyrenoidosus.AAC.24
MQRNATQRNATQRNCKSKTLEGVRSARETRWTAERQICRGDRDDDECPLSANSMPKYGRCVSRFGADLAVQRRHNSE